MTPVTFAKRLRRNFKEAAALAAQGNRLSAVRYFLFATLRMRRTIDVVVESTRLRIRTHSHDLKVALSCLRDNEFADAISVNRNHNGLIIDAGGYIGTAAIAFAKAFPHSTVVSLEPSHENFRLLEANVRSFKNIVPLNKAIADSDGAVNLLNRGTGEWGFTIVQKPADGLYTALVNVTECVSVPTLLGQLGKSRADILKIDIEGGEYLLLKHRPAWVNNIDVIVAELHERIVPGCTQAFYEATSSMRRVHCGGEKVMVVKELDAQMAPS